MAKKNKQSEITIKIELDEQNMPIKMDWASTDNPENAGMKASKAMMLSLFEKDSLDTVGINLWTKDFQLIEMDRFVYQSLMRLTETYFKATRNKDLANDMHQFTQYFGEKTEIIPPNKGNK